MLWLLKKRKPERKVEHSGALKPSDINLLKTEEMIWLATLGIQEAKIIV